MAEQQESGNISPNPKVAYAGLNLDSVASQIKQGQLSWAINAIVENFDGNSITYQNEQANIECVTNFPLGYKIIGIRNIIEDGIIVVWLSNPSTGGSEIGVVENCVYSTKINANCLNLDINHPILKSVYRKNGCDTEVYFTDSKNVRRYINLNKLPYRTEEGCPPVVTQDVDCNLLSVQPDFAIPEIAAIAVDGDGELVAGTYQFAIAYSDPLGSQYTAYYSITNPVPIFDPTKITLDFNYLVSKSISLAISNIDTTSYFQYFNLAVVKTVNNISSVDLVGTFQITGPTTEIAYTGQGVQDKLSIDDIFQKFPIYPVADDVTTAQDVLIWKGLSTSERISYQKIANQIKLQWQTWKIPQDSYANPLNSTYLRGYMRDETYPFEVVFLLTNGKQTDGFHIPGRLPTPSDLEYISNDDVISGNATKCDPDSQPKPRWQVYNTGCIESTTQDFSGRTTVSHPGVVPPTINTNPDDPSCYIGPFQYGCFSYWESTDRYPCDEEIWGDLANQPIRHHKFPDSSVTHIHDSKGNIYPIGIRINVRDVVDAINNSSLTLEQKAEIVGFKIVRGNRVNNKSVVAKGIIYNVGKYNRDEQTYFFPNYPYNDLRPDPFIRTQLSATDSGFNAGTMLNAFGDEDYKKRWTFHSPDTHFFQPTLGNILKLETAEYGLSKGHFQQVKNHSRYKFLSAAAYATTLTSAIAIGALSRVVGVVDTVYDVNAAMATWTLLLDILERTSPRINFTYQFNSIGLYTNYKNVDNSGNKQRWLDIASYMSPGMINIADEHTVNNFQRESSVYVKSAKPLPPPSTIAGVPEDISRYINSDVQCDGRISERDISSYYASIKRVFDNQYGQIYSYETIDTGFQVMLSDVIDPPTNPIFDVFGGDVFINRMAYKSKLPFFIDNRVSLNNSRVFPDEADISYSQLGNVAYPNYWFDTDSQEGTSLTFFGIDMGQIFGIKSNNLDCDPQPFFYQKGKIYLFAYGIPYFFVESEVNVDYRQAFNGAEGDFFPRVSSGIPDEWLQETNVTIQQDNTYYYNKTYSKQNKENLFTHLPNGFSTLECTQNFPFRAIFSEQQNTQDNQPYQRNNWLIYKPSSYYDFPQNYGRLVSLDGIENRQVLARFENKSLLYNALLTAPTTAASVYLGQSLFSQQVPPLDYADTDLGFSGTQHKLFLKTQYGHISTDSKRGQVLLFNGQQIKDLTEEGVDKFFTTYLDFQIQKAFPTYNIDNNYNGVGLHGVFDVKYNRFILTKIDYKPISSSITLSDNTFSVDGAEIELTDKRYFQNYSFTVSYCFKTQQWISFHTYIPNFYIGEANFFHSGINSSPSIWTHNVSETKYNNFYGEIHPYVLEYPYAYEYNDEILQNVKDYTKTIQYTNWQEFTETDDVWWNKAILSNNQQSSGLLLLTKKPQNNLSQYKTYPVYNTDSKEILWTKRDNFYQINTFWGLNKTSKTSNWIPSTENISIFKEINQANMDYSKRSFRKEPLRAKDLKIRLILDNRDDTKFLSMLQTAPSMKSFI